MSENRDNFIKSLDDSQCGITYKMESVYSMLKDKDLELYLKLVWSRLYSHFLLILCSFQRAIGRFSTALWGCLLNFNDVNQP